MFFAKSRIAPGESWVGETIAPVYNRSRFSDIGLMASILSTMIGTEITLRVTE
jgi:hypothetical protein